MLKIWGSPKSPRMAEPLEAALVGAGFFFLVSALAGGAFFTRIEERLWAVFQKGEGRASAKPLSQLALAIQGQPEPGWNEARRREELARDLRLLARGGAKAIVLEAWLDDASQRDAELMLEDLSLAGASLPAKSAKPLQEQVLALRGRLGVDDNLAEAMRQCGNVILPLAFEEASLRPDPLSGTAGSEYLGGYKVSRKGRGEQILTLQWRPSRAPLRVFAAAAAGRAGLAAPAPSQRDEPVEAPLVFQARRSWVNGLGLEAARRLYDVPNAGLRFFWRGDEMTALELKGARHPFNARGTAWLGAENERAKLPWVRVNDIEEAPFLADIKDKVVFYQPWPQWLALSEAFTRQREIFCALVLRQVQSAPSARVSASRLWAWLGLGALAGVALAVLPFWAGLSLALGVLLWLATDFAWHQALLARPATIGLGLSMAGLGLGAWWRRRRQEAQRSWLRGWVAPEAQALWQKLIPQPQAGASLRGAYVVLSSASHEEDLRALAFAAQQSAFVERPRPGVLALFLPLLGEQGLQPQALLGLKSLLAQRSAALTLGAVSFEPRPVFDGTVWQLSGQARETALELLGRASPRQWLLHEMDYTALREQLKVQLLGQSLPQVNGQELRIFNVAGLI